MKSINSSLLLCTLLALAGVTSSYAAVSTPGNLVIGFRATDGVGTNSNVVIDLGAPTDIKSGTQNSYNLSGVDSILSTTYGANWWTRDNLYYGVISYSSYEVLDADGNVSDINQSFSSTRLNNSPAANISPIDLYTARVSFENLTLNTPDYQAAVGGTNGTVTGLNRNLASFSTEYLSLVATDDNSWSTLSTGGWANLFADSQDNLVSLYTSSQNALNIYKAAGGLGDEVLSQSLTSAVYISNGTLVVVPEPSTYMLLGLSAVTLFIAIRRRKA
jgi:hypothetical protein